MKNVLEVIEKIESKTSKCFCINELNELSYANFQTGDEAPMGLLETQRAGHISPRKFVAAQCNCVKSACDCHIRVIKKIAVAIRPDERMHLNGLSRLKILPIVTARLNYMKF